MVDYWNVESGTTLLSIDPDQPDLISFYSDAEPIYVRLATYENGKITIVDFPENGITYILVDDEDNMLSLTLNQTNEDWPVFKLVPLTNKTVLTYFILRDGRKITNNVFAIFRSDNTGFFMTPLKFIQNGQPVDFNCETMACGSGFECQTNGSCLNPDCEECGGDCYGTCLDDKPCTIGKDLQWICGKQKKPVTSEWWFWLIIVIVILILLVGAYLLYRYKKKGKEKTTFQENKSKSQVPNI